MSLISSEDREQLKELFSQMPTKVSVEFFTDSQDCMYCDDTQAILEELSGLSEQVELTIHHRSNGGTAFEQYQVDKVPGIVMLTAQGKDQGIRYYGIPSGYEFSSLIEDLLMLSQGDSGLSPESRKSLEELEGPVHLQVFVTPTCPYCPSAVRLAHQMAMESPLVTADMVEATEFPELSQRYGVMGVPRTVINESHHVEGAVPETTLVPKIMAAASK
jgi:glutaredoxin-like protein